MKYKFRAECGTDVSNFLNLIRLSGKDYRFQFYKIISNIPDIEVEIKVDGFCKDDFILLMRQMDDSHVMIQTIMPIDEYTGERDYNIE